MFNPEQKAEAQFLAKQALVKLYASEGDILNWGKILFPDKFNLPFCKELHEYFIEIAHEPFTDTLAPRGHAKCLDGDTNILGEFGVKKIKDIQPNDIVYSIDSNNKVVKQKILAVQGNQLKKGYILKTRTGKQLKLSDQHRMFTFDGYKEIEQIKVGDYIGALNTKVDSNFKINIFELMFISYMIFEGCCTNRSISIHEPILIADFETICINLGLQLKKKKGYNCDFSVTGYRTSRVKELLQKYNIYHQLCYDKRLPQEFFKMSYSQKMIFLSIMIDTDGFISQEAGQIGVTLANEKLIDDIQLLLSSCGIISSKNYRNNDKHGAWGLTINASYAKQFIDDGRVMFKKKKLLELQNKSRYSLFNIFPNKIKKNVVNIERLARENGVRVDNAYEITIDKLKRMTDMFPECKEFRKQLDQDIFWDKVVSIERVDKVEEYYDIQVEHTENFIANGLVSHNTAIKCFLIPLFIALNEPERYKHYLNIQKTSSKAVSVNLSIRTELELNELLIAVYGDQKTEKWTEKQFVMKNGVIFSALGAGDSIRGIQVSNKRPDYIILDDMYDDEESNNVDRILKINNWFWASVFKAVPLSGNKCIHIQGTAVNKFDLMHLLSTRERWTFRKFQAVKDDAKKIVLWPEAQTYESLMMDKDDMGTVIFEREMMNNCRDNETQIIKDHWIKYHDEIPADEKIVMRIAGNDPSIGAKEESDYTALATIYVTRKDNSYRYYIQDLVNEHLSQDKRIKMVDNKNTIHKYRTVFVEAIAGFKDYCAELRRQTNVPVKEIDHVKDKITNLENNSSKFENGKVSISLKIPDKLRNELVYQLTTNFPRKDDLRDSVLVALNGVNDSNKIDISRISLGQDTNSSRMDW